MDEHTLSFNNPNIDYFIYADTHFGHGKILEPDYDNRLFPDIKTHDRELIINWNNQVKETDIIFFIGDFALTSKTYLHAIMKRLNGIKYFIKGNHDKKPTVQMYKTCGTLLPPIQKVMLHNQLFILCHFPIESWEGKFSQKAIHIHGHTHTESLREIKNRYNVSANLVDYTPVNMNTFEWIK